MRKPRIVIVGAGFAGFHAARTLCRLAKGRAEVVVVNPTDYFLYVPLLPEVATGILEPRRHAERQGKQAAHNIAATFGSGELRPYKHNDLGFVVDLGGTQAAANPLHIPLAGLPAKAVTRGYHLLSMPGNRLRTGTDWLFDAVLRRQTTQLGVIPADSVPLETATPERVHH